MADNYVTDPGVGGLIFKSDEDVGGVHWPVFKLAWGPLDTFNIVADSAGLRLPVDAVQSGAWSVSITGSVAVTGPLTDAQLRATAVPVSGPLTDAQLRATAVPVSGPLTDAQLRASSVVVDSELPTAALLADNTANPTVPGVGAYLMGFDGTNWDRVQLGGAASGALKVDGSAVTQPVSGTFFQATQPVSIAATVVVDTEMPAAAALADNHANPTAPAVGAFLMAWDGTNWDRVQTGAAAGGAIKVDGSAVTQPVSGPLTDAQLRATPVPVSGTVTANLAAGTNTNEVVGDAAHDAVISGNPVRTGGRAMSADFTAVTTGDTTDSLHSLTGKQVVMPHALPAASESYASPAAITNTTDVAAFAAGAAGVRHYITGVQVFNGHDTVGTEVVIKDGATVIWRGWAEQTGGGCSATFPTPLRGTAATAVNVANITTGSSTYFNLQGYQAAE